MNTELIVVLLFSIATGVALLARWLKLPYTAALVVTGLVVGAGHWFAAPHLSQELLFAVFLPGLLFEAAFHIQAKQFLANKLAIHTLAVPGVVAAIVVTALLLTPTVQFLQLEPGFHLIDAFIFGGIVAATDPIAVVALFKTLGAPKRLGVLIEGESLLNDGTAVVLFGVIFSIAMGKEVTVGGVIVEFLRTCGFGILVGAGLGYLGSRIIHAVDDAMIEVTVTVVLAWGSFALAEQMHVSGVLATVTAGLFCGNDAAKTGMSPTTKIAVVTFWSYVAFALNSIIFLLIGLEVEIGAVLAAWQAVLLAWFACTAARAVVIALVSVALRRTKERLPPWWATVMCWGGIRGGLSMVLVLALPEGFPHRQFLINVVFGVVVVSILFQGLTMAPLLRRLGLVSASPGRTAFEAARIEALAVSAAIAELQSRPAKGDVSASTALQAEYHARLLDAEERMRELHAQHPELKDEEQRRLRRHLLVLEKDRVMKAAHDDGLEDAAAALVVDIDARLARLDDH